jgi:hypothetical protein
VVDVRGGLDDGGRKKGAARPESLGGRSTAESMPVHEQSFGFREGGQRGITMIQEEDSGT